MIRQNEPIIPEYAIKCKELLDIMGLAYFQADGEAETLCAELCINNQVDAVLSEDTDVLAYGTVIFLSKIDMRRETVTVIFYQDILNALAINSDQFLDMCIMLSCDYNERAKIPPKSKKAKPVGLGCAKVYDIIVKYKSLENAEEYILEIENLKYPRCRELFTPKKDIPHIVPYNRSINEKKLTKFISQNDVTIRLEYILDSCKPVDIIYKDDDESDPEI